MLRVSSMLALLTLAVLSLALVLPPPGALVAATAGPGAGVLPPSPSLDNNSTTTGNLLHNTMPTRQAAEARVVGQALTQCARQPAAVSELLLALAHLDGSPRLVEVLVESKHAYLARKQGEHGAMDSRNATGNVNGTIPASTVSSVTDLVERVLDEFLPLLPSLMTGTNTTGRGSSNLTASMLLSEWQRLEAHWPPLLGRDVGTISSRFSDEQLRRFLPTVCSESIRMLGDMCDQGGFDELARPGPARLRRRQLYGNYAYYQPGMYPPGAGLQQQQPQQQPAPTTPSLFRPRSSQATNLGSFFDSLTPHNQRDLLQSHFIKGLINVVFTLFITLFIVTRVAWV